MARRKMTMLNALMAREAVEPALVSESFPSDEAQALPPVPSEAFICLGLAQPLLQAVADLGFVAPTAVQQATIERALATGGPSGPQSSDLMVSSQTGSGKTAAFLLPVLHKLLARRQERIDEEEARWARLSAEALARGEAAPKRPKRKNPTHPRHFKPAVPGALVLCPTRELAQQVSADAIDLVRHCKGVRVAHVVGGMPYQLQIARLQNADLVVATPGRLLDLHRSQQIKLDELQILVVDEADRMLDLGFADDLAEVHQITADRQQTLMFSATFAPRIMQLAARLMRAPERIQIDSPQEKHQLIEQTLHWADHLAHKRQLLDHWLRDASLDQAVVFASTQIECDALAQDLEQGGFHAVALHGALSQGLRNRRLSAFREGRVQILVATDVAARGLDVPTITHVINFGLPMKAEDYVHRIGRTGRAGRRGQAVTLAERRDRRRIADIEHYTRQPFRPSVIAGLEPKQAVQAGVNRADRRGSSAEGPRGDRTGQGQGWSAGRTAARGKPARGAQRWPAQDGIGRDARRPAGPPQRSADAEPADRGRSRGFDPRFESRSHAVAPRPDFAPARKGAARPVPRKTGGRR